MTRAEIVSLILANAKQVTLVYGCTDALCLTHEGKVYIQDYSIAGDAAVCFRNRVSAVELLADQVMIEQRKAESADDATKSSEDEYTLLVTAHICKVEPDIKGRCRVFTLDGTSTLVGLSVSQMLSVMEPLGFPIICASPPR